MSDIYNHLLRDPTLKRVPTLNIEKNDFQRFYHPVGISLFIDSEKEMEEEEEEEISRDSQKSNSISSFHRDVKSESEKF